MSFEINRFREGALAAPTHGRPENALPGWDGPPSGVREPCLIWVLPWARGAVINWLVGKAARVGCDREMLWKGEDLGELRLQYTATHRRYTGGRKAGVGYSPPPPSALSVSCAKVGVTGDCRLRG